MWCGECVEGCGTPGSPPVPCACVAVWVLGVVCVCGVERQWNWQLVCVGIVVVVVLLLCVCVISVLLWRCVRVFFNAVVCRCDPLPQCGWCGSSNSGSCVPGTSSGPTDASCAFYSFSSSTVRQLQRQWCRRCLYTHGFAPCLRRFDLAQCSSNVTDTCNNYTDCTSCNDQGPVRCLFRRRD